MEILPADSNFMLTIDFPDGLYAVRAYVDRNRNGHLDTSRSGRPREPFAISIGAQRRKPSSRFRESIFLLDEINTRINLTLSYPRSASVLGDKSGQLESVSD